MKRSARLAVIAFAALAATGVRAERCIAADGDSLRCGPERVRLFDVYAPELNQAGGRAARRSLANLVDGREVKLVRRGKDRYGRTLADLYVDGRKVVQSDIGPRGGNGVKSGYAGRAR